jgi:WhiB family redox-sensing transcriptional regulator
MYCNQCPVVKQCLEHALKVKEPYGVWGGLTTSERAALESPAAAV